MTAHQLDLLADLGPRKCRACDRTATTRLVWASDLLRSCYARPDARDAYRATNGRYPALVGEGLDVCRLCVSYYRGMLTHRDTVVYGTGVREAA
ncbi:hypothetical protein [Embleya sp. NPDC005971]|uniref:hypothetical protein n=1 Tax=Embleya sp. NPDC005971 TaxID=3156724 RepID=UPI0033EAEC9D